MERLLKYYHKFILAVVVCVLSFGCLNDSVIYKRKYNEKEIEVITDGFFKSLSVQSPNQGTVAEQLNIQEVEKYLPGNASLTRATGIPYLKRGLGSTAHQYYSRAADLDPLSWAGNMAYCWLYFYRDYETALERFEQLDTLTPNTLDYPFAISMDYMRGICYLQLGNLDEAIYYFDKHLIKETTDIGPDYIDALPYQLLGIAYFKDKQYTKADSIFNLGLSYNKGSADLFYYKSLNHIAANQSDQARESFANAKKWFAIGGTNTRPYVEEFYAIYQEDLDGLAERL